MTTVSEEMLEKIEDFSMQAIISFKTGNNEEANLEAVDSLLKVLEDLIKLSADRFMSLKDGCSDVNVEDDPEYAQYIVAPEDLSKANKIASFTLLKIISDDTDTFGEDRATRASRIFAHLIGRGAAGSIIRTWHIPYLNEDGVRREVTLPLHEPSFIENDLGFKTWGAAPMLSKKLLQERIIPNISESNVLELGTGTGMVGLICDYLGAKKVHMTDYHSRVLENVAYNIQLNKPKAVEVSRLDFIKVAKNESPEWQNLKFDIVIASDLLYEIEHAEYLPVAVEKLMKSQFYFMIPLRDTHWEEVKLFESRMEKVGLFLKKTQDFERKEEEGMVKFRYYEYTRE